MLQKDQYVRLHTNDEWHGLYGIINDITDECITVFCVKYPLYMYFVWRNGNESQILEFINA